MRRTTAPFLKDVMTTKVVTVESHRTILEAATIMSEKRVGGLPVLEDGRAVGIVTERDVLRRVVVKNRDPSKITVEEVMSTPLITAGPNDTVEDAARVMIKNRIRRLPIVKGSRLVGIVTSVNLMKHLGENHLSIIESLKATPEIAEDDASCHYFKPDPYLQPEHVWLICGGCYWFLYDHCIREAVKFLKHLPAG